MPTTVKVASWSECGGGGGAEEDLESSLACLRQKSAESLLALTPYLGFTEFFGPVEDGEFMLAPPDKYVGKFLNN